MIPSLTTLLSTVAGKVAVGVVVATTSVGAAAAAGGEVPFVSTAPTETETTELADESEDDRPPADETATEPLEQDEPALQALELPAEVDESDLDDGDDSGGDAEVDEDGERAESHGAVVSGFVHETELEGCAKGQATAAVARGDIEPGDDGTIDPAEVEAYLAELDKCVDDEDDDAEVAESSAEADDADQRSGKPDHAGERGKPDHAGERGKPDHAGKPGN